MDAPGSFGEWLRRRRKALDLTQEELAQRAGCSIFALRKIESGERRPSKQLASLLGAALEIPEEERQTLVRVARGEWSTERLFAPAVDRAAGSAPDMPVLQKPQREAKRKAGPRVGIPGFPMQPTRLLGREAELAALERLFKESQCRLLTLTGPGGIGKTRLATEFALRQREAFPGGVHYVPLVSVNSAELIVPAIAEALEFSFSGPLDPKEQLINYLASEMGQACLLVLDNMEQLLGESASEGSMPGAIELISVMLQRLPELRILTTSRERLNLQGEWMYELHGLPVPSTEHPAPLEEYGAVALFLQNARRTKSDFEISPRDEPALVRICQMLEGSPLALELAATWVQVLSCNEIANEIQSNMDFVATRMRDIPERHRSMRAAFNHSWSLLSGTEREALCRLAIFQGGFQREAADKIAGARLPVLASLVSKCLIHRIDNGRYDLHEVIRQFAREQLDQNEEANREVRDRHCEFYLRRVQERESMFKSSAQQETFRELAQDMENIRAAREWALQREAFALLGSAVRGLGWFFEVSGLLDEGIEFFEPLAQSLQREMGSPEEQRALGSARTQQGLLFFRKGEFDRAIAFLEKSLAVLRPLGEPYILTDALLYLGVLMHVCGAVERSRALVEEGLSCARSGKDQWFEAYAIFNLGYLDSLAGHYVEARQQMLPALNTWRRLGDPYAIALGCNYLTATLIELGCYAEAEEMLQESLELCEQTSNRWGAGTAYRGMGLVKMAQGSFVEARSLLEKSLDVFGDYIVGWDIARSYTYLAETVRKLGEPDKASRMYMEALRLAKEVASVTLVLDVLGGLASLRAEAGEFDEAAKYATVVAIHRASTRDTRERAGQIVHEARAELGDERVTAIAESSQPLDLLVEGLLGRP